MTTIEYTCKLCKTKRAAEYDETCDITNLEAWRGMLCCNRCYDYMDGFRRIRESIYRLCMALQTARWSPLKQSVKDKVETDSRNGLTNLTRKLADHVCTYYCLETVWEEDLPNMMLEHPSQCVRLADKYRSHIRRLYEKTVAAAQPL